MKTLIIYTTKTGATEKYSKWMQDKITDCEIQNIELEQKIDFEPYERIIFVLPTYSGNINKKEVLESSWNQIQAKEVYLVVIGGVPQESSWSKRSYNAIKEEVRTGLKGYVKIIGLSDNPDRKMGRIQRFMTKVFLGTDPDTLENRKEVFETDLQPVWEMLARNY